ncbi:MAG: energy-coupling factor transporter transmembrane component T [Sphaerochaetaceae bacterium]
MNTNTFIAGRGLLYWFDARAKLLTVLLFSVMVFFPSQVVMLAILMALIFIVAWRAVTFKQALKPLRTLLFILVVMALFIPLNRRDGVALLVIKSYVIITKEGLNQFLTLALRLLIVTYLCTLYIWTTPMADINLSFRWYGLSYKVALTITLAFRFIPFIGETFTMIRDSHSLRSAHGESEGEKFHIKDLVPTVTSALVFALKTIPHLATTLEHRGFGSGLKRSDYKVLEAKGGLFIHFLLSAIILLTTFVLLNSI